jgi:CRISPR-associated protein Csx14
MGQATIPVDLTNPGQAFACLGFLEAADTLLGEAEGGFDWSEQSEEAEFCLSAGGIDNPVDAVLTFLAEAEIVVICPAGVEGPWPDNAESTQTFPAPANTLKKSDGKGFTASALPIRLQRDSDSVPISHWLERASLNPLKLFAGQQVGARLAANMLIGDPSKKGAEGFRDIYSGLKATNFQDPFNATCPVGGRFGFDARGSWDAMRIGTSLDQQGALVKIAPHVEVLAAIGLENTRPISLSAYQIRYAVWTGLLPITLCRAALFAPDAFLPGGKYRFFRTHLGEDKQYKKLFFAEGED